MGTYHVWTIQALGDLELAATGETARRRDASTRDDLTPQELQIARLLADGKTTREAAAAVFLSPKTIEYHLRNVYRKLGTARGRSLLTSLPCADQLHTRQRPPAHPHEVGAGAGPCGRQRFTQASAPGSRRSVLPPGQARPRRMSASRSTSR